MHLSFQFFVRYRHHRHTMCPEDVQHLTKPLKESSLAEDPEDVEDLTNPLEEPTSVETKAALFSFGGGHLRILCELVGLLVLVFVSTQRSSNISSSSSGGPPVGVEGDCIRGKPAAFGSHPFFSPVVEDPYNLLVSRYRLQLGEVSVDLWRRRSVCGPGTRPSSILGPSWTW